jgi:integrase
MKLQINCLLVRNGRFVFRISVPDDLRKTFCKNEIKKVLPSSDLNVAARICNLLHGKFTRLFSDVRKNMVPEKDIKRVADEYLSFVLAEDDKARIRAGELTITDIECNVGLCEALLKRYRQALAFNKLALAENEADFTIAFSHLPIVKGSDEYKLLCHEILSRLVVRFETEIKRAQGDYGNPPLPPVYNSPQVGNVDVPPGPPSLTLEQLREKYFSEKEISKSWANKTKRMHEGVFNLLFEVFGKDTPVTSLTHSKLLDFRDNILINLPANREKHNKYEGKSYDTILKMKGVTPMCKRTVNERLSSISSFFKWCSKHEFMPKNIADGLIFNIKGKASEERAIYEKEDITKIFENLPYGDADAHKYWVPIIALYSGMRQSEICQMLKKDIVKIKEIYCFSVNETDPGKSIKTASAQRLVPVHPILLELGFIKYCDKLKGERIWPRLKAGRDGFGQHFQRWYGRFNRKFVTESPKKTFHSARHSFINCLKQAGAQETLIKELVGHLDESITTGRYGKAYNVGLLFETIKKVDYAVDWKHLVKIKIR